MNNMPAYAIGMADHYEGPIEDPGWLGIERDPHPGQRAICRSGWSRAVMQDVDVAYAEEWKFDHGIMVPLHFLTPSYDLPIIPVNINCQGPPLTPLHRAWAFGEALRRALRRGAGADRDRRHRRHLALAGDARLGKDQRGLGPRIPRPLVRATTGERAARTATRRPIRDAGQGGFEIRTFVAARRRGARARATVRFYAPIPIFAVGCTVALMAVE